MAHLPESASWDEGVALPHFPALSESLEVDVAIVGGGITGLTAAYLLSKAGVSVAILEKNRLGFGATGATTAFLTQYIDTQIQDLLWMFGREKTRTIFHSHAEAINQVERIIQREKIACEFTRCPLYVYAESEKDWRNLTKEQAAGQTIGLSAQLKQDSRLPFSQHGYLETRNQAKFHPRKYLRALVEILKERGVSIYEKTEIKSLTAATPITLFTPQAPIRARHVFIATYAPFNKKLFFKKAFYTSYVYETRLPKEALPEAIYEDTADPYHYFRVDRVADHDRLIVGGEDHRSDIPVSHHKNFQALNTYISQTFSTIPYTLTRRWHGPIAESVDGLAFIGPIGKNKVFYATGFSGNGMTYSFIAAQLFADFVRGQDNPWFPVYAAKRRPALRSLLVKGRDYSQIMLGGAVKNALKYRAH